MRCFKHVSSDARIAIDAQGVNLYGQSEKAKQLAKCLDFDISIGIALGIPLTRVLEILVHCLEQSELWEECIVFESCEDN